MIRNNSNKPTEWPGFMDTKSPVALFLLSGASVLSEKFSESKNPRSKRVGTMIRNMCMCMIENDRGYFEMFESSIPIWDQISADWNDVYVSVGGKLGSGKFIEAEPKDAPKIMEFYSQYPPEAIILLQNFLPTISQKVKELTKEEEYMTVAQLNKFHMFFHLLHNAIALQDKWFDTVEKILNSQADNLLSIPLCKELGVDFEEDGILKLLYIKHTLEGKL